MTVISKLPTINRFNNIGPLNPRLQQKVQFPVINTLPVQQQGSSNKSLGFMPASVLFGGSVKALQVDKALPGRSGKDSDRYIRYTPFNTACPLATWHTFATSKAVAYHHQNAAVLEKYIAGTGEYYKDIPWIKHGKAVGEEPYTIFDTETTGLKSYDRIVQLAATKVGENHKVDHQADFNTYINPGMDSDGNMFPIKEGASEVHGIYPEDVIDKPIIEEHLYNFRHNLLKQNGLVVAYNAKFDIHYINNALDRWNKSSLRKEYGYLRPLDPALVLDPFVTIQRIHPFVSLRKRLCDHYEILMGRPFENQHDAQADVEATVDVLKYTMKYLQKHAIPQKWAQFVDSKLPQKNWDPAEKSAVIARIIRENRKQFETKMPAAAEPLKIVDILKFQHGGAVSHEGSGLPKLDVSLNIFGWDGSKEWKDRSDALDPEIAQEVRQEREQENKDFVISQLINTELSKQLESVAESLVSLLPSKGKQDGKNAKRKTKELREELLKSMDETFVMATLKKQLPAETDVKGWKSRQNDLEANIKTFVTQKLDGQKVPKNAKTRLLAQCLPLAKEMTSQMQVAQKAIANRFLYTAVALDPQKPLIDPAVFEMDLTPKSQKRR